MVDASSAADSNADRTARLLQRPPPLLVGRSQEQAVLREELATAFAGHGRFVLLGGEAGIGKTALAQSLVAASPDESACVLIGRCYDLTNTPPYGPWRDLFDGLGSVSALPPPPSALARERPEPITDQTALFAEVRRFFADVAERNPLLVLLEDLHWSDPASLELLRHVAPYVRLWPMLLLVTYRVDELTRSHPFARQLPALVRDADGVRLDLRRLDVAAQRILVSSRYWLTADDETRLVAYLDQHAEGNPFFATELLRALEENALLQRTNGDWRLARLERVLVPSFLRQVIEGRVARLGEDVREPLAMAAVIGQDVPLAVWAEVTQLGEETLLAIVDRAVDAHLMEAERDGVRVRFVHALTREALYEGILPPRRRLWHRLVAEALLAGETADPDKIAFHLQEAGDPRAWEWLIKAGDRAQRAYAWLTAAERLRAAASLLSRVADTEATRCRLACRIGWLLRFSDPAGAIAVVDDAMRAAARIDDALGAAELGWVRGTLLFYSDRFRAAISEMSEAQRRLDTLEAASPSASEIPTQIWFADALPVPALLDTAEDAIGGEQFFDNGQGFRRGNLLWAFAASGRRSTDIEECERFVAHADVPGTRGRVLAAVAFTYHGLAIAYAASGRPDVARRTWIRARELFASFDHHALTALTLLNELRDVALTYGAASPALRRALAADAEAALRRAGGALRPGVSPQLAWLGCLVLDGHWAEADQILEDMPVPGNACLRREVTCAHSILARYRGEANAAWRHIQPLFPMGPATEPGDLLHQEGLFLQRLAADLCLDAGDVPAARAWLEAHDDWLSWSGSELGRAEGQVSWARWHWVSGDRIRAHAAANEALTLAAMPDQPLVWLAIHRLLGEVELAAGAHTAAEGHLMAAVELATACEAPFERAMALLTLAELREAMGAPNEAARILDEVRQVCIPLGAAPIIDRSEMLASRLSAVPSSHRYPDGLTQREVDVLRLLPRGLSNTEIAEVLFVSPRTVQTHLTNLYSKLGIGGRAEAVAYAIAHGLS